MIRLRIPNASVADSDLARAGGAVVQAVLGDRLFRQRHDAGARSDAGEG